MRTEREKIYWLCQLAGWGFYAFANIAIFALFRVYSFGQLAAQFLICAIGLLLTHGFRLFVKKRGWTKIAPKFLIPRIVIACIALALLWELSAILLLTLVFQIYTFEELNLGVALGTIFSWSATLLIWSLIYFGFHLIKNHQKTEIEKWRLEAAVKDAELCALKTQLNPHFIFNCLNSIRALIIEDPARAQLVVTQLANILRYSLQSNGQETVSLAEELQTVSDYLALETVRFEERLNVVFDVDPATLRVRVPTMLIQTLVENGIKHGIATRPEGGEISLNSQFQNSKLRIQISNTGQIKDSQDSTGIGIKNATERLKLIFGDAATLTLKSTAFDQVTAQLEIPLSGELLNRDDKSPNY